MSELPDWLTTALSAPWIGPTALIALGVGIVVLAWLALDLWAERGVQRHVELALASPRYEPGLATWDEDLEAETVRQAEAYLADRPFDWRETGL